MENKKHVLNWIWNVAGVFKWSILALIVLQGLLGFVGVMYAWFFRNIVDSAVNHLEETFWINSLLTVGLMVLQISASALTRYINENTRANLENVFKTRLFNTLLNKSYSDVTKTHSGEWMNRLTSDTVVVADGVTSIIPSVLGLLVKLVGAIIFMYIIVPEFLIILIPAGFVIVLITYIFRKKLKRLHKNIQEADGRLRVYLTERLSNLLVVKAFVKETDVNKNAFKKMSEHKNTRMTRLAFSNTANVGFAVVVTGTYVFSAIYCGYGILENFLTYGTFVAVLQLVSQIQMPFSNISSYLPKYYATSASAERLQEAEGYSDDQSEPLTDEQIFSIYNNLDCIEFKNVSFSYEKTKVLENFNLNIQKGDFVALKGVSGSGKSTFLKLLMNVYEPESGQISFTNRNLFAYVPQGNFLMSGTIRDIVSFGKNKSDQEIWNALKLACADDFVESLDQELGEGGSGLSEGQIQRIAIARALATNRPILLLDECTSSLDEDTESKLLENIRELKEHTVIIVTHRKKALELCDKDYEF